MVNQEKQKKYKPVGLKKAERRINILECRILNVRGELRELQRTIHAEDSQGRHLRPAYLVQKVTESIERLRHD